MSAKYDPFLAFFLSFELMKIDDHGTMHLDGLSDFDGWDNQIWAYIHRILIKRHIFSLKKILLILGCKIQ